MTDWMWGDTLWHRNAPISRSGCAELPTSVKASGGELFMKRIVVLSLLILAIGYAARAQDIVGDWQGTLKIGTSELRLVVHITKGDDGNLKATMDSIDYGAKGYPISSISLQDSKLSFTSEAIHGSYEGTINKGATEITGTFTQGSPLPLDLTRMANRADGERRPGQPSDIDGAWAGVIDTGTSKLRIVFHITNTADGLAATIDSPDQGAKGLPG